MKTIIRNIPALLLTIFLLNPVLSQDNRTLETKVADLLAQFPAQDAGFTNRLMTEIMELGSEGIARFCDRIVPPGTGDDVQARYAIGSLARYAGDPAHEQSRKLVESSLLKALEKATDTEVKAFFIRRLALCGNSATVSSLEKYINSKDLFEPALATLSVIGTHEAATMVLENAEGKTGPQQIAMVRTMGVLHDPAAEPFLVRLAASSDPQLLRVLYWALADLATEGSAEVMKTAAGNAGYSADKTGAMVSYLHYAARLGENGSVKLSHSLCMNILKHCKAPGQLQYRSSALEILRKNEGTATTDLLLKEVRSEDKAYRNAVLRIASEGITSDEVNEWIGIMKKSPAETQAEILYLLAPQQEEAVLEKAILPSLASSDAEVRNEAVRSLAINQKDKAIPVLLDQLKKVTAKDEYPVIETALLTTGSVRDGDMVAANLKDVNDDGKIVLIHFLAAKRATGHYGEIEALCTSRDSDVRMASFQALKYLARTTNLSNLMTLLQKSDDREEIIEVQQAIESLFENDDHPDPEIVFNGLSSGTMKEKLIPILPYLNDDHGLKMISGFIQTGNNSEKKAAFEALTQWPGASALPVLFDVYTEQNYNGQRKETLDAFLKLTGESDIPADQKLLWLEKIMPECSAPKSKSQVIRAAGSVKTFLSLVFVSKYLDQEELSRSAASAVTLIALPTPGEKDGLNGHIVRKALEKSKEKLTGPDSQYIMIDIQEYLDNMPGETGYVSIFNGKDLSGWQGLVKNPVERANMSSKQLAKEQAEADKQMVENWAVKDGCIIFNGNGANLCTKKIYKDFDMLVDWRITKNGDSGIYLRGTPQVQIWDTSRVDVGAQVGSGGLYNNQENRSTPLVLADNAIGDWNTFRIHMTGNVVTVYLNGQLVVDHVVMENYWNRGIPLFSEGPIELQAHGSDLAFRNLYVRELNADDGGLNEKEKAEGFVSLFNGRDLDGWVGNKTDYTVEDGVIAIHPKDGSHGNLYTEKEYSNFIFRFEFQLTPGANNGLGIHAPLEGDAAYVGKELQILDNTAPVYANLQPYQYHGSVYGIIPAKRGYLKPVGEWNVEEVVVKGDDIKITLNGTVIVDGNVKEATKNGTPDHKDHPGLERHTGHIGFLGHGSELKFRKIRIKEL